MGVTTVRLPPETEHVRWKETLESMEAQGRVIAADQVHEWLKSWGTKDEMAPPGNSKRLEYAFRHHISRQNK